MTEPNSNPKKGPVDDHWKTKYRMVTSIDDLRSLRFWKAVAAEFVGTMLLVLVGCGSCIGWVKDADIVQISLCFGLSVATVIWIIGHVSGGHVNPAVTAAFFITRRISLARAVMYIVSQCVGAIIGAGILKGLTPPVRWGTLGATLLHNDMDGGKAFGVELFITFVLVLTVFATCDKRRKDLNGSFPLSIGLSVTMCHLFAVSISNLIFFQPNAVIQTRAFYININTILFTTDKISNTRVVCTGIRPSSVILCQMKY